MATAAQEAKRCIDSVLYSFGTVKSFAPAAGSGTIWTTPMLGCRHIFRNDTSEKRGPWPQRWSWNPKLSKR